LILPPAPTSPWRWIRPGLCIPGAPTAWVFWVSTAPT